MILIRHVHYKLKKHNDTPAMCYPHKKWMPIMSTTFAPSHSVISLDSLESVVGKWQGRDSRCTVQAFLKVRTHPALHTHRNTELKVWERKVSLTGHLFDFHFGRGQIVLIAQQLGTLTSIWNEKEIEIYSTMGLRQCFPLGQGDSCGPLVMKILKFCNLLLTLLSF